MDEHKSLVTSLSKKKNTVVLIRLPLRLCLPLLGNPSSSGPRWLNSLQIKRKKQFKIYTNELVLIKYCRHISRHISVAWMCKMGKIVTWGALSWPAHKNYFPSIERGGIFPNPSCSSLLPVNVAHNSVSARLRQNQRACSHKKRIHPTSLSGLLLALKPCNMFNRPLSLLIPLRLLQTCNKTHFLKRNSPAAMAMGRCAE